MSTTIEKKKFLTNEVPQLLAQLKEDDQPSFGIMTPQHMVEHLIWVTKSMPKRHGEPDPSLAEKQTKWQAFLAGGARFKHSPKEDAKLGELKYSSLEQAISEVPFAIERMYKAFEENDDYKAYNPMMGEIDFPTMEQFQFSHYRYHLSQFGLVDY